MPKNVPNVANSTWTPKRRLSSTQAADDYQHVFVKVLITAGKHRQKN
jgi:hypothetical protein